MRTRWRCTRTKRSSMIMTRPRPSPHWPSPRCSASSTFLGRSEDARRDCFTRSRQRPLPASQRSSQDRRHGEVSRCDAGCAVRANGDPEADPRARTDVRHGPERSGGSQRREHESTTAPATVAAAASAPDADRACTSGPSGSQGAMSPTAGTTSTGPLRRSGAVGDNSGRRHSG